MWEYPVVANAIYMITLGAVLFGGAAHVLTNPSDALLIRERRHREPLLWLLIMAVGFLLTSGISTLLGSPPMGDRFGLLVSGLTMNAMIALVAFPMAAGGEGRGAARRMSLPFFFMLMIGMLCWSVWSLAVLMYIFEGDTSQDFFLEGMSGTRPFEYLAVCCFALAGAILEEVIFRGGLTQLLRKLGLKPVAAVVLCSVLWSMGHVGYVEPHGIKEAQIIGLGLIYGWVAHRFGLRQAILLHVANNAFALVFSLIRGG